MTDQITMHEKLSVDVLARTMWGEARGEGVDGLRAVAHVVMNRVACARENGGSWWGHDIISVCQKPFQFSCWNRNDPNFKRVQQVDARNPEFRLCQSIARRVIRGEDEDDPTYGATHYHRYDIRPSWARCKTMNTRIGAHLFYAIPDDA
jgi:N-acetylmuramoyl-L-alanine amidase